MGLFNRSNRRVRPPAGLRARLSGGERLLGLADAGERTIAASQFGLWIPHETAWRRIEWHAIVKATWTDAGLEVIEGTTDEQGIVTDLPPLLLRPAEPRNLPAVVRTRVERSIGRWEQVRVPGGTGRIVGRRRPGVDGIQWTARVDSGTPDSAEARVVLAGYLARVAALPPEALVES